MHPEWRRHNAEPDHSLLSLSLSLSLPFTLCMFPSVRVRPVPVEAGGAGSEPAWRSSKKIDFIVVLLLILHTFNLLSIVF